MPQLKVNKIIPIALALIIIAVIIATIVTIVRVVVSGGDTSSSNEVNNQSLLLDTSADRAVTMSIRGNLVADENFQTYQIKISPNSRIVSKTNGYLGQSTVLETLNNNIPAYEQFVYALDKANFMDGTELTGDKNDLRGICATGNIYSFELLNGDAVDKMLWTSTCSGSVGSFSASVDQVSNLFTSQIPDAASLIGSVWR